MNDSQADRFDAREYFLALESYEQAPDGFNARDYFLAGVGEQEAEPARIAPLLRPEPANAPLPMLVTLLGIVT